MFIYNLKKALNKSILDLSKHANRKCDFRFSATKQALKRLLRGQAIHGLQQLWLNRSFLKILEIAITRPLAIFILALAVLPAAAQTAITYQGQLNQSGAPFTGLVDMEFRLYDSLAGGLQVGSMLSRPAVPVEDGLFQVELDFGAGAFTAALRYLEIDVSGTTLSPRQAVHPSPMALFALAGNEGPPGPAGPCGTAVRISKS